MTTEGFAVRAARWPADAAALRAVREAVFVEEQGVPADLEWDQRDAQAWHWLAEDAAGRPVGTARLLPTGQIGRMAVLTGWRRRGVGTALLRAVLRDAPACGVGALWLNAQCSAQDFYARAGFVAEGPVFAEAGIPHRSMRHEREEDR
jgi:predicted GNAT family N-acyltransferase